MRPAPSITPPVKWKLSKAAIKNLREVQERIKADPNGYRQDSWNCGTAMCIAGHVALVAGARINATSDAHDMQYCSFNGEARKHIHDIACQVLGRNPVSLNPLFAGSPELYWPKRFASEWKSTEKLTQRLQRLCRVDIAVRRINYFIRTGK